MAEAFFLQGHVSKEAALEITVSTSGASRNLPTKTYSHGIIHLASWPSRQVSAPRAVALAQSGAVDRTHQLRHEGHCGLQTADQSSHYGQDRALGQVNMSGFNFSV